MTEARTARFKQLVRDPEFIKHHCELRRLSAELSLVSQAGTHGYDFAPSDVGARGWRTSAQGTVTMQSHAPDAKRGGSAAPTGGIDRRADCEPDFWLKSPEWLHRRLQQVVECHMRGEALENTFEELSCLRAEAQRAVDAWKLTPQPEGQPPVYGSPGWKQWIADSSETGVALAERFGVSPAWISMVRCDYAKDRRVEPGE